MLHKMKCLLLLVIAVASVWSFSRRSMCNSKLTTRKLSMTLLSTSSSSLSFLDSLRNSLVLSDNTVNLDALQQAILSSGSSSSTLDSLPVSPTTAGLALLVTAFAVISYEFVPSGSCREDLVDVRKSQFIRGGLGLVAKKFIAKGTEIGQYPGIKKSIQRFKSAKFNEEAETKARRYTWQINDDLIIDPTDSSGVLPMELSWFGLKKVSTSLARINEPPKGKDTNVFVRIENNEAVFIAERDIFADEELFIDYGLKYDRSDYPQQQLQNEEVTKAKQERVYSSIEPVFDDNTNSDGSYDNNVIDADVISIKKTKKRSYNEADNNNNDDEDEAEKDERYRKRGILSPDAAVKLFQERGATGLFATPEDQELIDAITGKSASSLMKENKQMDAEWSKQWDNLMKQAQALSQENADNEDSTSTLSSTTKLSISKPRKSIFDSRPEPRFPSLEEIEGISDEGTDLEEDVKTASISSSISSSISASSTVTPPTIPRDVMIDMIQEKVQTMSDEEVSAVASKLAKALFSATAAVEGDEKSKAGGVGIDANTLQMMKSSKKGFAPTTANARRSNRNGNSEGKVAGNAAIREKYAEEFQEFENILGDMYKDPISTLQEILKNPDKYLAGIEENGEDDLFSVPSSPSTRNPSAKNSSSTTTAKHSNSSSGNSGTSSSSNDASEFSR